MSAPVTDRLTIRLCGVGGQMLVVVVRQLARRLAPLVRSLHIEETHGMAQRGGTVSALIEAELVEPRPSKARTVLLGLERIEGARALGRLCAGDAAFIATGFLLPPGNPGGCPPPTVEQLMSHAEALGIDLVMVDTSVTSPAQVVQAAIDSAAIL